MTLNLFWSFDFAEIIKGRISFSTFPGVGGEFATKKSRGVLVVLGEGPAPEVMNRETKHDNLEEVSLLSADLTPGVDNSRARCRNSRSNASTWWYAWP